MKIGKRGREMGRIDQIRLIKFYLFFTSIWFNINVLILIGEIFMIDT